MVLALLLPPLHDVLPEDAGDFLGVLEGGCAVGFGEGGLGAEFGADLALGGCEDGAVAYGCQSLW